MGQALAGVVGTFRERDERLSVVSMTWSTHGYLHGTMYICKWICLDLFTSVDSASITAGARGGMAHRRRSESPLREETYSGERGE